MTLAQWAEQWPYVIRQVGSTADVLVTPDTTHESRSQAFWLEDYLVSSVSGGSIWFRRRLISRSEERQAQGLT